MQKPGKAWGTGRTDTGPPKATGGRASLPLLPHRAVTHPHPMQPTFSSVYVARSMISGKCSSNSRMTSFIMSAGGWGAGKHLG